MFHKARELAANPRVSEEKSQPKPILFFRFWKALSSCFSDQINVPSFSGLSKYIRSIFFPPSLGDKKKERSVFRVLQLRMVSFQSFLQQIRNLCRVPRGSSNLLAASFTKASFAYYSCYSTYDLRFISLMLLVTAIIKLLRLRHSATNRKTLNISIIKKLINKSYEILILRYTFSSF